MKVSTFSLAMAMVLLAIVAANSQDLPRPDPSISPIIPAEVNAPTNPTGDPTAVFDDFSWRSFVALNWPVIHNARGVADTAMKPGDNDNSAGQGPVVWETWKADYELFQVQGLEPTEWTSFDSLTPCKDTPATNSGQIKVLGSYSKFGDFNQAGFGNLLGPLVAQNGTYIRYDVRVNQPEFDFIRNNKLYIKDNFPKPGAPPLRFPNGSIEIKAAWRVIKPNELEVVKKRYYVAQAMVLNPITNACDKMNVALVGLHIVQKTPLRPQWVWSSFEHVDNVPDLVEGANVHRQYSFNNPNASQALNPPKALPPISASNPPTEPAAPLMQVVRQKDIAASTKITNAAYQKLLAGTVWENYELVMTQWPTQPVPADGSGVPFPSSDMNRNLANTSMETFFQMKVASSGEKAIGCMNCHDIARSDGTDFVWFMHLRAFGNGTVLSTDAISKLRSLLENK